MLHPREMRHSIILQWLFNTKRVHHSGKMHDTDLLIRDKWVRTHIFLPSFIRITLIILTDFHPWYNWNYIS